jgi:hypothetical protein
MSRRLTAVFVAALLVLAVPATADEVVLMGGLSYDDATVVGITNGELEFRTAQGRTTTRPLGDIERLMLTGQRAFNDAEESFATNDYLAAIEGYQRTVRGGSPDWLKNYAGRKLMAAATAAGQFDAAVIGYAAVAEQAPDDALLLKPDVPDRPGQLQAGDAALAAALDRRPDDATRRALLSLRLELLRGLGDDAALATVLDELSSLSGGLGADTPAQRRQLADLRLGQANLAIDRGNADEAAQLIDEASSLFVEPQQAAEALFLRGRAKEAAAGEDAQKLKDAALDYMRVVAHYKNLEGKPKVAASLLRAAAILDRLGDASAARNLYQAVATETPEAPEAAEAKRRLAAM